MKSQFLQEQSNLLNHDSPTELFAHDWESRPGFKYLCINNPRESSICRMCFGCKQVLKGLICISWI